MEQVGQALPLKKWRAGFSLLPTRTDFGTSWDLPSLIVATANGLLGCFGLRLSRKHNVPSWDWFFSFLNKTALRPRAVFDIGVAYGTPKLYAAFPDAKFYLIDPTRESLPYMQKIISGLRGEIANCALGAQSGEIEIAVRPRISDSSILPEFGDADIVDRYLVNVERFDTLFPSFERPALCKIDVQGAELLVLEGMRKVADQIDVIVVEASTISSLVGGAEVFDVMQKMNDLGFCLYDFISITRRPLDQALAQVDLVFVRQDSPLRADRRWKS